MDKDTKQRLLEEHFIEYLSKRELGLTHDEAIEELSYLHPITMTRLEALIEARKVKKANAS